MLRSLFYSETTKSVSFPFSASHRYKWWMFAPRHRDRESRNTFTSSKKHEREKVVEKRKTRLGTTDTLSLLVNKLNLKRELCWEEIQVSSSGVLNCKPSEKWLTETGVIINLLELLLYSHENEVYIFFSENVTLKMWNMEIMLSRICLIPILSGVGEVACVWVLRP